MSFVVHLVHCAQLHPYYQQRPIVEYCRKKGIIVQAYCPLIRGAFHDSIFEEVAKKVQQTFFYSLFLHSQDLYSIRRRFLRFLFDGLCSTGAYLEQPIQISD